MTDQAAKHYTASFTVDRSPRDVFEAINNARGWWSQEIEGDTDRLGAVFYHHYQDVHRCTIKITELVPETRIVWHVLSNDFSFVKDKSEWVGTDIVFEIGKSGDGSEVRFTHVGLAASDECYDVCSNAWSSFITRSLRDLIATGKGQPNPRDPDSTR